MAVFWKKVHIFLDKLIKLNEMELLLDLSSLKAKSKNIIPRTLSDLINVASSPFPHLYHGCNQNDKILYSRTKMSCTVIGIRMKMRIHSLAENSSVMEILIHYLRFLSSSCKKGIFISAKHMHMWQMKSCADHGKWKDPVF